MANEYCDMEISVLRASPYNLVQGDLIIAKMEANNVIGWSEESTVDGLSTAEVQTQPLAPSVSP